MMKKHFQADGFIKSFRRGNLVLQRRFLGLFFKHSSHNFGLDGCVVAEDQGDDEQHQKETGHNKESGEGTVQPFVEQQGQGQAKKDKEEEGKYQQGHNPHRGNNALRDGFFGLELKKVDPGFHVLAKIFK